MFRTRNKDNLKVLIISSIIPCKAIERKVNENNVLFVIEEQFKKYNFQVSFDYLFVFPRSSFLLSLLKKKWASYYRLQKKFVFYSHGRQVKTFPIFQLSFKTYLRRYYYSLSLFLNRKKIDQLIKGIQPDLIHAQNVDVDAFAARWLYKKYGIPYVVSLRSIDNLDKIVRNNLLRSKRLISLSYNSLVSEIKEIGIPYSVIPHGITSDFYVPIEKVRAKETSDTLKLITVGRLLSSKNIDFVIKELAKVKSKIKFEYNIFGNGPEYNNLKTLIEELGLENSVHLHGQIPYHQVKLELSNSDLFLSLSYPETFGRVFIETMAVGTPFIGKSKTGIYGLVIDGEEAIYCSKHNFIQKLEFIAQSPARLKQLSINARLAAEAFNWEQVINSLNDVYIKSIS